MCSDNHEGGACKDVAGLVSGYLKGADWVVLVGADNYVVTRNIEKTLGQHDSSVPQVLGIKGCGKCSGGGLCGGGGQIFSRAALRKMISQQGIDSFFLEENKTAIAVGMWGDVANCQVASNHGVRISDLPGLNGWHISTSELEAKLHRKSPEPLTFHYVSSDEMQTYQSMIDSQQQFFWTAENDAVEAAFGLASWYEERARYIGEEQTRRKKHSIGSLVLNSEEESLQPHKSHHQAAASAAGEAQPGERIAAPNILVSIGAGTSQISSVEAALSTWGAQLPPEQVQVMGIATPADSGLARLAHWDKASQCDDNHAGGACKDVAGLVHGYKKGADWVILVGADNYVMTRNLAQELGTRDPSKPEVLGIKGCGVCSGGGLCGGGGQIFSKAALQKMMQNGELDFEAEEKSEAKAVGMWGDVANCRVATKHKVPLFDLPGLYGWKMKEEIMLVKFQSKDPAPLIFHYLSPNDLRKVHGMAADFHQLYQSFAGDHAVEAFGLARWYHERAVYIQEEQDKRQLRPLVEVFLASRDA